jgi:hypothetical protein
MNSLLKEKDLSALLCTCRGLKETILEWENVFWMRFSQVYKN